MIDSNAKLVGILCYLTIIGWIVAIVLHGNKRSAFGAFHLRQSLGLFITGLIIGWIPVIGWMVWVVVLAFLIVGFIYAIREEMKTVPLIGDFYQNVLSGIN